MKRCARGGLALALALTFVSCNKPVSKDVAATVNGRPILYGELERAIAAQFPNAPLKANPDQTVQLRLETLRALIDNEILLQRAEREGLLASDADVEAKFNEDKALYTQEQFQKLLNDRKMSVPDFKAQIRRDLSVQKLFNKEIGSHISISDADVAAFYNANKSSFNLAENKVRLAQILVTPTADPNVNNLKNDKAQNDQQARNKISMIDLRVRQGEDFATLAQNYSEDANTAPNGGDLGFVPESALEKVNPELRKAILEMTPGQVSPVLRTAEGYRIIKLISKEPAGQRQLSDPRVQEEIRQGLFQAKEQVLRSAFYEVARSEAKVVNYYAQSVLESRDKK
ncbi:MAG: peptidylprolyl isomerase [Acidobacteriaceae bacterium]|nr:peptidylprolyl isomerase [Acidobacteriaceae bacterium]